jgi:hypothetical protein
MVRNGSADIAKGETKIKIEDCKCTQKYFKDGRGRGWSWSTEGKRYYNDRFDQVQEDWKLRGRDFDDFFLRKMTDEISSTNAQRNVTRKIRAALGKEILYCRNDSSNQMLMDAVAESAMV